LKHAHNPAYEKRRRWVDLSECAALPPSSSRSR
jgi:hypothetical protein